VLQERTTPRLEANILQTVFRVLQGRTTPPLEASILQPACPVNQEHTILPMEAQPACFALQGRTTPRLEANILQTAFLVLQGRTTPPLGARLRLLALNVGRGPSTFSMEVRRTQPASLANQRHIVLVTEQPRSSRVPLTWIPALEPPHALQLLASQALGTLNPSGATRLVAKSV
jgi:hypothetical protein